MALVFALLPVACAPGPVRPPEDGIVAGATGVRGTVRQEDGAPASGATVYAYRSARSGLRGPADFGVRVAPDGSYFLDLAEGDYHLVARLRHSGADSGPPRPGDAWALYPRNPVRIERNEVAIVHFILQSSSSPRQARQGSLASGDTGFSGRLVDAAGRPLAGAFALAYRTDDFHRMPDFTSFPADAEGEFTLYVPEAGRYCLAARNKTRGQPRPGEPYGTLGRGEAACRDVRSGEIRDVGTIVLTPYR